MRFSTRKVNTFMLFKLPSAYFTGVRLKYIDNVKAIVKVKHRWVNQNPFKSMFWAIQGMASEFSTGILVMKEIYESNQNISMLVTNMNATFDKKATGRITFVCEDGNKIKKAIKKAVDTKEGQKLILTSEGFNEEGVVVSKFEYEWSLKIKA